MKFQLTNLLLLVLLTPKLVLANTTSTIGLYINSQSYSNILPVKQLVEDSWKQAPRSDANRGFTQNEIGLQTSINNFYFGIAKRFDYFVYSNSDTAEVLYLERERQPLNGKYKLSLDLFHQYSHGLRFGYKLQMDKVTAEVRLGYWQLEATRESKLSGELTDDMKGGFIGDANFTEYYTESNFLKRNNTDDWNTSGTGFTLDVLLNYRVTEGFHVTASLMDVYSDFIVANAGYSEGNIDTDGTFSNSLGGVAYVPLFRGKEITQDHHFKLPEQTNLTATYASNYFNYVSKYKRQGNLNFYYIGFEVPYDSSNTRILLDIKNSAPEIQFHNNWINISIGFDNIHVEKTMQLNFSLAVNYPFK